MPLYICNSKQDALDAAAREKIAKAITRIHCSVTGAPEIFVHAVFFEESPLIPLENKTLSVRGTIRKGRSDKQKNQIAELIRESLIQYGEVPAHQADALDSRDARQLGS